MMTIRKAGRKFPWRGQKSWAEFLADLQSWREHWSSGPAKKREAGGFQVVPEWATPSPLHRRTDVPELDQPAQGTEAQENHLQLWMKEGELR